MFSQPSKNCITYWACLPDQIQSVRVKYSVL